MHTTNAMILTISLPGENRSRYISSPTFCRAIIDNTKKAISENIISPSILSVSRSSVMFFL